MLIDKGYYDYDYTEPKEVYKPLLYEDTVLSDDKLDSLLSRLGLGTAKKELTIDEIQQKAMADLKNEKINGRR